KEISALASWTVTSAKPGCGIPQLRNSSTSLFWQSDGPQPHCLNIHFFKLVEICGMRIFLDFEQDESYTPTKIQFLAGMGYNDLQMFGEMAFEQPRGWIDVDFSGKGAVPILRAFLVQVKIVENHQNGKDTHLRGLQIFAKDKAAAPSTRRLRDEVVGQNSSRDSVKVPKRASFSRGLAMPQWSTVPELR
ncbi:galactose-binding like protein, partial [Patellaria atrata CBS 101060]